MNFAKRTALFFASSLVAMGCAAPSDEADTGETSEGITKIAENAPATQFPEVVLVNARRRCSGVLIGPRSVLTAGHCVKDAVGIGIVAPNAGGATANASVAFSTYYGIPPSLDFASRDVALLTLDTPIALPYYPPLAARAVANGRAVRCIGREHDGTISDTQLFVGRKVVAHRAEGRGFLYSYVTRPIVERGDAGGPAYVGRTSRRKLVGIIAGPAGGSKLESIVARIENPVTDQIRSIVGGLAIDDGAEDDAD